jgi:hypothetical protein
MVPAPDEIRMIQVLLNYCVVFLCSCHQVLKSRTPHSGAGPKTLHPGAQIQKTDCHQLPRILAHSFEKLRGSPDKFSSRFTDLGHPRRDPSLLLGCLEPDSVTENQRMDCGADERHAVRGCNGSLHRADRPDSPCSSSRAPRYGRSTWTAVVREIRPLFDVGDRQI